MAKLFMGEPQRTDRPSATSSRTLKVWIPSLDWAWPPPVAVLREGCKLNVPLPPTMGVQELLGGYPKMV